VDRSEWATGHPVDQGPRSWRRPSCAATAPGSGAKFNVWHPRLITLHFWVWYPNYTGIYTGTNPMVAPFNHN
jgi:hypothetical protein